MSQFAGLVQAALPEDAARASLAGRAWRPELSGPSEVAIRDGAILDISAAFPTMRDLCESPDPAAALRAADGELVGPLKDLLANTPADTRDPKRPWLLAPIDLQAIKAAGVTFAISMLERVIEERARGDMHAATAIRA
jgi:fumarylacetoacetate (FAA) hydrolase family protein